MDTSAPHTHREYDDKGRIILEVFESDEVRVKDIYQYEKEWIIREQEHYIKSEERGYLSVERFREDGSAWTQKFFDLKTGRLESEMRQIDTAEGCIWHDIDYHEDGTISRSIHTTRQVEEGTLEQTIKDGKIESYTLSKPDVIAL